MSDDTASPMTPLQVRDVLGGQVIDGAIAGLRGSLVEVKVTRNEQSGQWASGHLVDSTGAVEFIIFPRAFARTDQRCFDGATSVAVTGRVSISDERTALVLNDVSCVGPANV